MGINESLKSALENIDSGNYEEAIKNIISAQESTSSVVKTLEVIRDNPEWQDHHCRADSAINKIL